MSTEITIIEVQSDPNLKPVKGINRAGRKGYSLPVVYVLENGAKQPGSVSSEKLKNVAVQLTDMQKAAQSGSLKALFSESGFVGIQRSYSLR